MMQFRLHRCGQSDSSTIELLSFTFTRPRDEWGRRALNYVVRTAKNRSTLSDRYSLAGRRNGITERQEGQEGSKRKRQSRRREQRRGEEESSNTSDCGLPSIEKRFGADARMKLVDASNFELLRDNGRKSHCELSKTNDRDLLRVPDRLKLIRRYMLV
ncbi:hypothetical protein DMN91_001504 [Ooceraea biroi]|uniref:Uncharacterized protein n=1 Tax=Ooceraea biroi TaxID=2015173 RepID=A0A3L8DZW1_OOCBI|nr:hypothetical protein DMN91_001504 [Ooceraea biroi]